MLMTSFSRHYDVSIIFEPAEKCSYRSIKKGNMFKAKANSNRCPDHLSRQILTTSSTFPYSSKNSSAEHTRFINMAHHHKQTHSHKQTHKHMHTHTYTH